MERKHGSYRGTEADHRDTQALGTAGASLNVACAACNSADEGTSEDRLTVDTVAEDMPILAHRYAAILPTDGGLAFGSLNAQATFGVDADAICNQWRELHSFTFTSFNYSSGPERHTAPALDCVCGFYAVPADLLPNWRRDGYASLLVELSGTVIEHEAGYRAEHQRVVQVTPPPCLGCGEPPVKAWRNPASMDAGLVWDCGNHELLPMSSNAPVMAMTLADIANLLGVPVVNP
jgi:hypothetical protein